MPKRNLNYRQVELRHYNTDVDSDGQLWYTSKLAYIPDQFSDEGHKILIEDKKWFVFWRSEFAIPEGDVPSYQTMIKLHRHNTGDSLPKKEV